METPKFRKTLKKLLCLIEMFFRRIDSELHRKSFMETFFWHLRILRLDARGHMTCSLKVKMAHYVSKGDKIFLNTCNSLKIQFKQ